LIGKIGCSGSCTGSHIHFEIRVNGTPQNPMSYF
jgi:murein DD-endopeptidase MepM/ murein hydrolase activator NlpD